MDIRDIQILVRRGESDSLEFKRKARFPEKIMKEVVAFANTKGGILMIGVDDNGSIPGLKFANEEAFVLEDAISRFCYPKIKYKSEMVKITEKKAVINYHIFESPRKPHFVQNTTESRQKTAYIRVSDRSIQASREMIEILRRKKALNGIKFHYGDKERILLKYLDENDYITIKKFVQTASISYKTASRTLVRLVLANVLKIDACEDGDLFRLKETV